MKLKTSLLVLGLSSFAAVSTFAASSGYSPIANLTERWTNSANWAVASIGAAAGGGLSNQAMILRFQQIQQPLSGVDYLKCGSAASDGRFSGNYNNSAITHFSFRLMRKGCRSATLYLVTDSGRRWWHAVPLPAQQGTWADVVVPLSYGPDWITIGGGSADMFNQDKAQISNVWISVQRTDVGEESIMVDDFKAVGPWEKGPMIGGVPQYWLRENGLPEQAGQDLADYDNDGFNNFKEYMAGTDARNPNDFFRLEIGRTATDQPILRWRRENYRSYTVMKSDDLNPGNTFVACTNVTPGTLISTAAEKSEVILDKQDVLNRSFYRVAIQQQQ